MSRMSEEVEADRRARQIAYKVDPANAPDMFLALSRFAHFARALPPDVPDDFAFCRSATGSITAGMLRSALVVYDAAEAETVVMAQCRDE